MLFLKARRRARPVKAIAFFLVFVSGVWIFTYTQLFSFFLRGGSADGFETSSSNSTLGFGRIYVVSQQGSPRRDSIVQAANVTELDLDIPLQPIWTEEDEDNFRLDRGSTIGKGSLLAWLGHLHVLYQLGARTSSFYTLEPACLTFMLSQVSRLGSGNGIVSRG